MWMLHGEDPGLDGEHHLMRPYYGHRHQASIKTTDRDNHGGEELVRMASLESFATNRPNSG